MLIGCVSYSQDTPITFVRVLDVSGKTKGEIFDKSLVWVAKIFSNSNFAIRVKERKRGIIAGKANYVSNYKFYDRVKKDSVASNMFEAFLSYRFDWLIEVKENKLRFTIDNLRVANGDPDFLVTSSTKPPITILFQNKDFTARKWTCSKMYLLNNLDGMTDQLRGEILKPANDF